MLHLKPFMHITQQLAVIKIIKSLKEFIQMPRGVTRTSITALLELRKVENSYR